MLKIQVRRIVAFFGAKAVVYRLHINLKRKGDLCTKILFYRQRPFFALRLWDLENQKPFITTISKHLVAPTENNPPDRKNKLSIYTQFDTLIPFQHQELFQTMIGPVRQVNLNFDQSGRSKGTASVVFARKNDAVRSVEKLRNITLDGWY